MKSNIYGASNLQFLNSEAPADIADIYSSAQRLIAGELKNRSRSFSEDDFAELSHLYDDLKEVPYNDFIDLDFPRFTLTPHEYDWLKCHEEEIWVDYLMYRYKFKVYPVRQKIGAFPVHLCIEPTSACNLRCVMCFQVDKSFSGDKKYMGVMPWELFTSVVDQAAENKCHAITLASRGEPTLHKRFGDMLLYIHDKGILDIKINTNATRFTEKLCHDILTAEVATVTLSVDACTKETYENIRVKGNFDEVHNNIKMFNDIREKHYPNHRTSTRIAGVAVEDTQSPEEMEEFWSEYVDHVTIRQEIPRWDSYGNAMFQKENICKLLYERIYVWYDGTCNPCDFDYKSLLAFGDATKESLRDIWSGDKYQQLRDKHTNKQRSCVVPCDRCPF